MSSYCSLADARAEINARGTADDSKTMRYIKQVSARIDLILSPRTRRPLFEPFYEERAFVLRSSRVSSQINAFMFGDALLAFDTVRVNSEIIASGMEAWPLGMTPFKGLRFVGGSSTWYRFCRGLDPSYVYITGTWGLRADYAHAWVQYDTVQTNPVAPSDASFKVANVDGDDPYGIAPRFSAGQLVKIGATSTEFMRVSATDAATNLVSVSRAQNGTSAPAGNYAVGEAVYVYEVEDPIRRITARQAGLMYSRIGAYQVESLDGAITTYPQDLLVELEDTLSNYQYVL